jgi:hypothetical protein
MIIYGRRASILAFKFKRKKSLFHVGMYRVQLIQGLFAYGTGIFLLMPYVHTLLAKKTSALSTLSRICKYFMTDLTFIILTDSLLVRIQLVKRI